MYFRKWISFIVIFLLATINLQLVAQVVHKQLREDILEEREQDKTDSIQRAKLSEKKEASKDTRSDKSTEGSQKKLQPLEPVVPIKTPYDQKSAKLIFLENADMVRLDQITMPDVQILNGHVRFRHDDAIMTCDSAYLYRNTNSLDAFSNVKIVQGDTLFVYGNKLYYDGNTKLVRLRGKAKMVNRETVLTTDSLNYDRNTELAYYFTGGKITDPENTLTSVWGQYSTATEDAFFSNKVKLVNENFVMDTDTLKYNADTHIAHIVGKTHIRYEDETDIYSTNGWYNTDTEKSMLLDQSLIVHEEGKNLIGDTIFYDKIAGYGEVFGNAILNDTVQQTSLYGHYIYYHEEKELGIATDSALLVDWSTEKHMYLHADTLMTYKDSTYNEAKAWRNARFYREDIQGISDSIYYSSRDSILHLYKEPVMWQESQQFSSDAIHVFTKDEELEKVHLEHAAMIIEQVDSAYFNQISGKEMMAYMDSSEIRLLDVNGNAETLYYIKDDKAEGKFMGANRTESSYVKIYFKEKKIDRIILTPSSSGEFHPLAMLNNSFIYLNNFFWLDTQRPKSKEDVFTRYSDGTRSSTFTPTKEEDDDEDEETEEDGEEQSDEI